MDETNGATMVFAGFAVIVLAFVFIGIVSVGAYNTWKAFRNAKEPNGFGGKTSF